jgi:protein TonB
MTSAFVVSLVCHAAAIALVLIAIRSGTRVDRVVSRAHDHVPAALVWLPEVGPGGGGGGGGNRMKQPPRRAEQPGDARLTVPVMHPVRLEQQPTPASNEPKPIQHLMIPAEQQASGVDALVGAMTAFELVSASQGPGGGGGAGTGEGGGDGPGRGRGLRDGLDAGVDGDRYGGGAGLVMPRLLRIVKPQYTTEAMTARIQGSVIVACIVQTDGSVADARVARSLDPVFGLDGEAINAARQWQFLPATRLGKPVPIRVTIEVTFTVR